MSKSKVSAMFLHQPRARKFKSHLINESGVTLLELIVYLVIAGILLGAAVATFMGQNRSYNRQDIIAEIQQNIRGVTEQMSSDIRFAGSGLDGDDAFETAGSQILAINLESDLNEDWPFDTNEDGTISTTETLNGEEKTVYYRLDGTRLQRGYDEMETPVASVSNWQTLAENMEELRFEYLLDDWTWTNAPTATQLDDIKAVKIVMLGAARASTFNLTDPTIYRPPLNPADAEEWDPADPQYGPGYKRMISKIIHCRNNRG